MRLLFIADGRSPSTCSWLQYWIATGQEVHLISTFPCDPPIGLSSFHIIPVAFSNMTSPTDGKSRSGGLRKLVKRFRGILRPARYWLGPLNLPADQKRFLVLLKDIHPDLVHALRIPFEGMLATVTSKNIPLVVSIWGNDLILHANGSTLMADLTRRTLRRTDGLIADARRDIRLAADWGFPTEGHSLVVPGGGGIRLDEIQAVPNMGAFPDEILPGTPIVVNPRGQRPGSLRQDVFFRSIPIILKEVPQAVFLCPVLKGDAESERLVNELGIQSQVRLWPPLSQAQLWAVYKCSTVFVSPSIHDGTPNSMLEAMACGCFPVVGKVESLAEWITPGENGLLVDATSPHELADGIISALKSPDMLAAAREKNARIISGRAEYRQCMASAEVFYKKLIAVHLEK